MKQSTTRRSFINGCAASMTMATLPLRAQTADELDPVDRNTSGFQLDRWQDHFDTLAGGVIISNTSERFLQYWSADESVYRLYPTSVPLSDDLTRLGYTEIIRKVEGPSWRPTPAMRERNPEWPEFVGPGPENPLGTHALYLSWQYYRIHGTNDTRKIGRRSSNGCIGLFNEQIQELYGLAGVGTQVKLI